MPFLHEKLETLREFGSIATMPAYIQDNVNPNFQLRPYQIAAFENFITYFEDDQLCQKPTQVLFHMATGSGKTMIMAGLMLYLYKKGYRNFLFFVNLSNIVKKTKENFLNQLSQKFLFAEEVRIDGERIPIKEVENFQSIDENAINICFTTTQGLHMDMWFSKENAVTIEDFNDKKIVLISDEAHHLTVDTKSQSKEEEENKRNWEDTVHRIWNKNKENVLLEFTATCDLHNPQIKAAYENKIVYDYPLAKFRADGYSKEIKTLRSDVSIMERVLQAIMLSQYRLKVFQDNRLPVKPVILFKSAKIADSSAFMEEFNDKISSLTGDELRRISELTANETLQKAYTYFREHDISFEQLAQELRDDFSPEHCISANDDKEAEARQIALNSLEDADNPYRAVFEVKKLDEGWDVLNLFDIVRLYETRQSGGKKISPATISEAQLIGRGARYCPFQIDNEQEKYKRKYDGDLDNPLRICEELYYHCQNDSRYIAELNNALKEIGAELDVEPCEYVLKPAFKATELYRKGFVFFNDRIEKDKKAVTGLLSSVRDQVYMASFATGSSVEDTIFDNTMTSEHKALSHMYETTIGTIAKMNYAIVHKALCKYNVLKFDTLKSHYPNLKSTREFIVDPNYMGNIKINITSRYETPPPTILYAACVNVVGKIAESINKLKDTAYEGTKEFKGFPISEIFKDKRCHYTVIHNGGLGVSQNDSTVDEASRIDLSKEDWFAFEDNFGTSEEKAFVAYFKKYYPKLQKKYDEIYLLRNERQLHIYSFADGERFEPDYVLFLHAKKTDGYEQIQIFIEPKGAHLIENDKWKEDFLLELKEKAVATTTFVDDNDYKIWGFHFFNQTERMVEFGDDMQRLLVGDK